MNRHSGRLGIPRIFVSTTPDVDAALVDEF
jgi:hypothetical protein